VNNPLATLTEQFLKERRYFKNVTPSTLIWYEVAFKNYRTSLDADSPSLPTKAALQQFGLRQRAEGAVRAVLARLAEAPAGRDAEVELTSTARAVNPRAGGGRVWRRIDKLDGDVV